MNGHVLKKYKSGYWKTEANKLIYESGYKWDTNVKHLFDRFYRFDKLNAYRGMEVPAKVLG